MKRMVCSKLGLDSTAPIKLFQKRAFIEIDLDDGASLQSHLYKDIDFPSSEDDFEVFKVVASKEDSVCVKVVIPPPEDTQVSGNPTVSPSHEST